MAPPPPHGPSLPPWVPGGGSLARELPAPNTPKTTTTSPNKVTGSSPGTKFRKMNPVLELPWLWHRFRPWPGNFRMLRAQPQRPPLGTTAPVAPPAKARFSAGTPGPTQCIASQKHAHKVKSAPGCGCCSSAGPAGRPRARPMPPPPRHYLHSLRMDALLLHGARRLPAAPRGGRRGGPGSGSAQAFRTQV